MQAKYRLEQFWQLVRARPLPTAAWQEIEGILSPTETDLFRRYPVADRRHAYRVLRTLREGGYEQPALLQAALLHDVGKARCHLHLWERIIGALADICCPGRVQSWGRVPLAAAGPLSWRRPFIIREQHPEWGAEMADAAGSSELVVTLIRHHQEKGGQSLPAESRKLLRRLQWADDQN